MVKKIQTYVHLEAHETLTLQAKAKGMSMYEYTQQILLAVSRGDIKYVPQLEVKEGKTVFDKR